VYELVLSRRLLIFAAVALPLVLSLLCEIKAARKVLEARDAVRLERNTGMARHLQFEAIVNALLGLWLLVFAALSFAVLRP
jgi:hypothetical protein